VTASSIDAADRQAIADVLVQYATGIDQREWGQLRACFTDDCVADYGDIGVWQGADEITTFMEEVHRECGHTLHRISNQVIGPDDEASADRAIARCYVDAVVMFAGNQSGVRAVGFYDDEFVRTEGGWRISRRRYTPVVLQMGIDNDAIS
jgi:SnoaL-like domain